VGRFGSGVKTDSDRKIFGRNFLPPPLPVDQPGDKPQSWLSDQPSHWRSIRRGDQAHIFCRKTRFPPSPPGDRSIVFGHTHRPHAKGTPTQRGQVNCFWRLNIARGQVNCLWAHAQAPRKGDKSIVLATQAIRNCRSSGVTEWGKVMV
jgi:hypothetical protein